MKRRYVGTGEMLAIHRPALERGVEGFFWALSDDPILVNRRHAQHPDIAIVTIRGSLEHHVTCAADSYEGILEKLEKAKAGAGQRQAAQQQGNPRRERAGLKR